MTIPRPELTVLDDVMEKCVACETYQKKGRFYADCFICEDCVTDGDALATLAWKLAEMQRRSLCLKKQEAMKLLWLLDGAHGILTEIPDKLKWLLGQWPEDEKEETT